MNRKRPEQLIQAALRARAQAYAPYSNFAVGAALATVSGEVFLGCNIENVSYGLTMCAERVVLGSALAGGQQEFQVLAIASRKAVQPCGACRQVLAEFCDDLPILLVDADCPERVLETRLSDLLPNRFTLDD